jgi:hypothetical protein
MTCADKLVTFMTQIGDNGERIELQYDRYNRLYVNGEALVTETKLNWFERGERGVKSGYLTSGLLASLNFLIAKK